MLESQPEDALVKLVKSVDCRDSGYFEDCGDCRDCRDFMNFMDFRD